MRLLLALGFFLAFGVDAATLYVSDQLSIPLRRGPSIEYKIINAGLQSGTPLEVLQKNDEAGFTQVRTPNGTEGWVPSQYLVSEPSARDRLAAATKRVDALEAELKTLRSNFQEQRSARSEAEKSSTDLSKQTEKLQSELAELRRVSGNAITTYEDNKRLKTENQSLQSQVSQLSSRVRELERNTMLRWLLAGGGLVLLGLVLGAWIKSRPKRSNWA
ncbi:MAG TPA: TIGR04211 family SH3 domain-containing protein [Steroidobacteraceae bacterium]|nr:TIGR04211 family SH3 domain-containing protein [Steroidobacteraceae bacterium]